MTVGNYIPETEEISLFRDPIFPGGVTIPIVGPVKPAYKIAAFFPTASSFGPIADLAEEWVCTSKFLSCVCFAWRTQHLGTFPIDE